ncbi:MAG: RAD55 family ATPase, partial [Bdellovibrionota bacterium]
KTGISKLDDLLGKGIPYGSSLLISGVAGTGKTLLSLEFIYRGAKEYGEKGVFISFEETAERLKAEARSMGWDIDRQIELGNIEIIFVPQTDIQVEKHLLMIHDRIQQMGAKRIAIDSFSLFVHKIKDEQAAREKLFQLATLVQMAHGIGFLATDIPYGSDRISRFGVEETVVDGVIILSSNETAVDRERSIEVYKLRNTAHASGKHRMRIMPGGIQIYPRGSKRPKASRKK